MIVDSEAFQLLFRGNPIAVGIEEGGCERQLPHSNNWFGKQLEGHLTGERSPVGVYPVAAGHVWWTCIDWDEGDEPSFNHALLFARVAKHFGIHAWIERSRSKGYHAWMFMEDAVPMDAARKAMLVLCAIAEVPDKEVNPKQFQLEPGKLGNYVRLPYPSGRPTSEGRRCMVDGDGIPIPLQAFLDEATDRLVLRRHIDRLANMWVAPKPVFTPKWTDSNPEGRLHGVAKAMWLDGPLDTSDRSAQLWRFARHIAEGGAHSTEEAEELLASADTRWWPEPKYVGRDDGKLRIREAVRDAYTRGDQ